MKLNTQQRLVALVAASMILSACGAADSGTEATDAPGPSVPATDAPSDITSAPSGGEVAEDGSEVLVEIGLQGGFMMIDFALREFPNYVLTNDGTLYSRGPVAEIFPGPAVPNIVRGHVSDDVLADVRQYVQDMDLANVEDVFIDDGAETIADAPETYVTYFDDAGAHTIRVYALGLDERPQDARVGQLTGLLQTLEKAAASGGESYVPERFEVHAFDGGPADPELTDTQPWPLDVSYDDVTPGDAVSGCVVLEGEQAAKVYQIFAGANELTRFDDGTAERGLVLKPLFEHQTSECLPG